MRQLGITKPTDNMPCLHRFSKLVTVEPLVFLYFVSQSLTYSAWQALAYSKFGQLERNTTFNNSNGTANITALTMQWMIYTDLVVTLPMIIVTACVSGYSVRHGLRLAFYLPLVGGTISSAASLVNAFFPYGGRYLLFVSPLASGLTGYWTTMLMATVTYVLYDTSLSKMAIRLGLIEAMIMLSDLVAKYAVKPLLGIKTWGLPLVLFVSIFCQILAILDVTIRLRRCPYPMEPHSDYGKSFCSFQPVIKFFKILWLKRLNDKRLHIHLITLVASLQWFTFLGSESMTGEYLTKLGQNHLGWYSAATAISIGGDTLLLWLLYRYVRCQPLTITLIGIVSTTLSLACLAYDEHAWMLWISITFRFGRSFTRIGSWMYVGESGNPMETAALMGYLAIAQAASATIGELAIRTLYRIAIFHWTGFVFIVAAYLCFVTSPILIFIVWNDTRMEMRVGF